MIFKRTLLGLSNLHLFLGVDAVVFVEGGEEQFSKREVVESGKYGLQSIDLMFWQSTFKLYLPAKSFQFRPIGSKGTLTSIASDIKMGNVNNIVVAMDRDHDNVLGCMIVAPGVIYSIGYSWENDVFNQEVVEEAFYRICPVCRNNVQISNEINNLFKEFVRDIRWAVYADILMSRNNKSFFPRKNIRCVLYNDKMGKPCVNRKRLLTLVKDLKVKRTGVVVMGKKIKFDPLGDCSGHLISIFCYRLVKYIIRKYRVKIPDLSKYFVDITAINAFGELLRQKSLKKYDRYYRKQLLAI